MQAERKLAVADLKKSACKVIGPQNVSVCNHYVYVYRHKRGCPCRLITSVQALISLAHRVQDIGITVKMSRYNRIDIRPPVVAVGRGLVKGRKPAVVQNSLQPFYGRTHGNMPVATI